MRIDPVSRLGLRVSRVGLAVVLSVGLGLAAACDTSEERAEAHYQAGLELLEKGDVARALIEFRNAFKLNNRHEEARATYARAARENGNIKEAYGQYLRLVEQYPENLEGQRALAELSASTGDWEKAELHVAKAMELAPNDLSIRSVDNAVRYFNAVQSEDDEAQKATVIKAQALLAEDKDLVNSRNILIDNLLRKREWYAALDAIDEALVLEPNNRQLYSLRMNILQQVGDLDGIEAQLRDLMERFPADRELYKETLVKFLITQRKTEDAETFIRQQADREDSVTADRLLLVGFLEQMRGQEVALAEVEKLLSTDVPDQDIFRSMRAKLNYQMGKIDEGITEMEALTKDAERTDQTRSFEVDLARMMFQQNNAVGARALIETILSEDSSQPDAAKLKANWLIDDDETSDAIVMLRDALKQSPEDADLLSLMARAYEREGNSDLRMEMLSQAVQASGKAPIESLRFARALADSGKPVVAEGVLIDSLRLAPQNPELLSALGDIYVQMEDWARTDEVVAALKDLNEEQSELKAAELTAQKLSRQDKRGELTAMLEGLTNDPVMGKNAEYALLRNRLANDGPEAAEAFLDELLAKSPDDPTLLFMKAGFLAGSGKLEEAEAGFRDLLDQDPKYANVWIALYRLKAQQGDVDGARKVLEEALSALPQNATLLWAQAGELERAGDIDGAIKIYEAMYAKNSDLPVIVNNLASLLANNRQDEESLQRAYTISRRLRDTDVPAFQDTYGWITYRRGSHEAALDYLKAAATGLPNDITVQYHLAANLASLKLNEDALKQFQKVQSMIDPVNPPPFAEEVASEIKRLHETEAKK